MGNVINLAASGIQADKFELREIRNEYGLSILQAAQALNLSSSKIEEIERSKDSTIDPISVRRDFEIFVGLGSSAGKNLIFGHYPLRIARELLSRNLAEMAKCYGYTANSWKRIEANARPLASDVISRIEQDVRDELAKVCVDEFAAESES